jgi:hypothetical protein
MTPAATMAKTISNGARRERTTFASNHPSLPPWRSSPTATGCGGDSSAMFCFLSREVVFF